MFRRGANRVLTTLVVTTALIAMSVAPVGAAPGPAEDEPGLFDRMGAEGLWGLVRPWLERLHQEPPIMKCDGGVFIDPNGCPKADVLLQGQPSPRLHSTQRVNSHVLK